MLLSLPARIAPQGQRLLIYIDSNAFLNLLLTPNRIDIVNTLSLRPPFVHITYIRYRLLFILKLTNKMHVFKQPKRMSLVLLYEVKKRDIALITAVRAARAHSIWLTSHLWQLKHLSNSRDSVTDNPIPYNNKNTLSMFAPARQSQDRYDLCPHNLKVHKKLYLKIKNSISHTSV